MKNLQKGFIVPIVLTIIALLILVSCLYVYKNIKSETPLISSENERPSLTLSNNCENLIKYSAQAYYDGWEKAFKKENRLSDSEFDTYVNAENVSLLPNGQTCELAIKYTIKKDWLLVNRVDKMTLGVPPTISPSNLPLERDPAKPGRLGVSNINLNSVLSFNSQTEALNFFISKYNLKGTNAKVEGQGFQDFYNKEEADKSNYPFAGDGGEAFIYVSGIINQAKNKCYSGELSLVSKETTYNDKPCVIFN